MQLSESGVTDKSEYTACQLQLHNEDSPGLYGGPCMGLLSLDILWIPWFWQ